MYLTFRKDRKFSGTEKRQLARGFGDYESIHIVDMYYRGMVGELQYFSRHFSR
jgi:hypothetical protein